MCCEAVIFFDASKKTEAGSSCLRVAFILDALGYRCKRAGQFLEKSRFLTAQLIGYLRNDAWLEAAKQANDVAAYFQSQIIQLNGCALVRKSETNLVFIEVPKSLLGHWLKEGPILDIHRIRVINS